MRARGKKLIRGHSNGSEWMGMVENGSGMARTAGNGSECPNSFLPLVFYLLKKIVFITSHQSLNISFFLSHEKPLLPQI